MVRVAGDMRLVVPKRYLWKTFEQIVTVGFFENQPPEVFCEKKMLLKILPISQENTQVGVPI